MTRRFYEEITCDRCGHSVDVPQNVADRNRDEFTIIQLDREDRERHICSDCRKQFESWWRGEE